ncbi:MAG: DUF349 domain-containing protein [Actinomycetales bacterium]|nr:DUF349 domain-containing protein [Actinomycetales bacterium]
MSDELVTTPAPSPLLLARRTVAEQQATDEDLQTAMRHGRVAEDGTVYLLAPEGEVIVGQWAAGPPADGLAFFARKFLDLKIEVDLMVQRLIDGKAAPEQAQAALDRVRQALTSRSFVGDLATLENRCTQLADGIGQARAQRQAARQAERQAALAARESLVQQAESLADSNAWKATTERFKALVEEWKSLPHAERSVEQQLWRRISAARTAFEKRRRAHFADLESVRKEALAAKRALIARAETLAASTDWAGTARKFRDLLNEWKSAPRGSKVDEDRLWKRFKAAQDQFFAARTAAESQAEEQLRPNVGPKEELVVQAESLVPISDPRAAKKALRGIQERWERIGDLPRADKDRLEGRLKRVEEAVRKSEAESWKRANPEALARAEATAQGFADRLAKLQAERDAAQTTQRSAEVEALDAAIAQTTLLMEAALRAATDLGGR